MIGGALAKFHHCSLQPWLYFARPILFRGAETWIKAKMPGVGKIYRRFGGSDPSPFPLTFRGCSILSKFGQTKIGYEELVWVQFFCTLLSPLLRSDLQFEFYLHRLLAWSNRSKFIASSALSIFLISLRNPPPKKTHSVYHFLLMPKRGPTRNLLSVDDGLLPNVCVYVLGMRTAANCEASGARNGHLRETHLVLAGEVKSKYHLGQ